jgi:hypothetical protein
MAHRDFEARLSVSQGWKRERRRSDTAPFFIGSGEIAVELDAIHGEQRATSL